MKFKRLKVEIIASDNKKYGYEFEFSNGLNIIKGDNSSGKSTFVNSLIYSLGMEEIIGAKGVSTLPYALKTHFKFENRQINIVESTVYVEIENSKNRINTFKRAITSKSLDSHLVTVIHGPYLSDDKEAEHSYKIQPTFVHHAGSAQDVERGFFSYLEDFLCLDMPSISDNKGKETKLYLQSIFSAIFVEQKRGWTDYIANIPYYSVSGMREKVVSYLLDLDVFRNTKDLNLLTVEKNKLTSEWSELVTSIKLLADSNFLSVSGLLKNPSIDFDKALVSIGENINGTMKSFGDLKCELFELQNKILTKERSPLNDEAPELVNKIEKVQNRIDELLILQTMCASQIRINQSQAKQYKLNLESIEKDLKANKLTKKLNDFGADNLNFNLNFVDGKCGTCLQIIDDILLPPESESIPMTIDENITHLDNQKKMISSIMIGLEKDIEKEKTQLISINREATEKVREIYSLRKDVKSLNNIKESDVREKIDLENRLKAILHVEEKTNQYLNSLVGISNQYQRCLSKLSNINVNSLSSKDWTKKNDFERNFRRLAKCFGYRSANIDDISVKPETMLPYLNDLIELRERIDTPTEKKTKEQTNIKSDSSASDFVRLIWAYLIALQQTSIKLNGNHPNFLLFDEPAQHSMGVESMNAMLKILSDCSGLQSIVAASFDEAQETFKASTDGVNCKVIDLPRKIIEKL
ncbi:hypothetical protein VFES401_15565 [Aliivibrio fischeri]|uniref:ATP-binding protein n=1 Tax=Aliivibrio fischeri TaxID=668 RepID=UPI00107E9EB1|nr:ATP-binding protein [Aliivibrio fischeri]TGA68295.1 hypothetical protein VFES401_15565 [Aliivibrio fischeri]